MDSYYDKLVIDHMEEMGIDCKVISDPSPICAVINNNFPFQGERIDFKRLKNSKFCQSSNSDSISSDTVSFIKTLLEEKRLDEEDTFIYVGDGLTKNGYELSVKELLRIIPFIIKDVPQHHYLITRDLKKIIFISFEYAIEFGELYEDNEVMKIISSDEYQALLGRVKEKYSLKIYDNEEDLPILCAYDKRRMDLANFHYTDSMEMLKAPTSCFIGFLERKIRLSEEMYSKEKEVIEDFGYSKSFLLDYMIEYYLLCKDSSENGSYLLQYIKAIRIPSATKYCKQLEKIFKLADQSSNK